jgi:hypothetical protein
VKYKLKYRSWIKRDGKYFLGENVLGSGGEEREDSLLMNDCDGKEIYEDDILEDEKGLYIIRYKHGMWGKYYQTGEFVKICIFTFSPGRIIKNKRGSYV